MTQYTKPTVLPAWGESAGGVDVLQPTNAEIQAGWPLSNVPPSRKRFNWILKYLAQGVRYMMQMGIPVWDSTEDYPVNARVMGSDGKTYKAILTGINKDPTTQPTYWTRWGFTLAELNAEGTTPPQFDNDTSLATTEFVQRALGSVAGQVNWAGGAVVLSASDVGKLHNVSGATTLPAASSVPLGTQIIVNAIGAARAVSPSGADTLSAVGTSYGSITLEKDCSGVFQRNSDGNGWGMVQHGDEFLKYSRKFGSSLTASGYQKLPSGLIVQWGSGIYAAGVAVTFPIAYPTACRQVLISPANYDGAQAAYQKVVAMSAYNQTTTGFTASSSNALGAAASWLAIGN